ncbi:MAG: radical SAM protein [Candidatus Thorarchaeota archaeon]|nr:radical SAM protein [Candidatus Thorarchaeota archaeon]
MNTEEILQLKVRLLTEGARIPEGEWKGRRGGAGPVGGRYFFLPNGRICGVPIRTGKQADLFRSASLEPTNNPKVWLYDGSTELSEVPRPKFYDMKTANGIPYSSIALLHGERTLATTVYQACRYWTQGSQCKFCTIPLSHRVGDTVLEKTPEDVAEVVLAALNDDYIDDVLLTTGTPDSPDMGIEKLINTITAIRKVSNIPIAVQFEPPVATSVIKQVAEAGANAVGIHIESADEPIREEMCPGKYEYGSLDLYKQSWKFALKYFEKGHVSTFILHGLGEDVQKTLNLAEELSRIGVMPIVAPVRPSQGSQLADYIPTYVGNLSSSVAFYKSLGTILFKHGLNPKETKGGCHKCGGCTPIQEAYDWAAAQKL